MSTPGNDGLVRPNWAEADELMRLYYDTEWGMPVTDERGVFERLCLEGFQAGLSWRTILTKRDAFRELFSGFEPEQVAALTDEDVERLASDSRIIRHRGKIRAARSNARATLRLRDLTSLQKPDGSSISLQTSVLANGLQVAPGLPALIWSFQPSSTYKPHAVSDIPTHSNTSTQLAKTLKQQGFSFIGPTSAFALMEAIGLVDTHLLTSHRRGSSELWEPGGQAR